MEQALEVFLNGIGGVFAGMGMLYVAIRLLALAPDRKEDEQED